MVSRGVYFDGVKATGVVYWKYNKSITNTIDNCTIRLNNSAGTNLTAAAFAGDIKIYSSTDVLAWRGEVYDVVAGADHSIEVVGYGYIRGLMTRFHTGTYTAKTRSYIVENLVDTYGGGITTSGGITATSGNITRTLKGISAFDAILELSNEMNYDIWVGVDNDFHFGPRGATSCGQQLTIGGGYVRSVDVPNEGRNIFNYVRVCGDANQDGVCETQVIMEDRGSQAYYGKVKEYPPVVDKSLRTTAECAARGQQILDENAWEVKTVVLEVFGQSGSDPGETILLSGFNDDYGVEDGRYLILERSAESKRGSQVLKLAQYTTATQDTIANLIRALRKQEYTNIDATASPTRYLLFYEDLKFYPIALTVYKTTIGNSMIAGHTTNGVCGNTTNGNRLGRQGTVTTTHYSES